MITLYLRSEFHKRLKELSKESRCPMSYIVNSALRSLSDLHKREEYKPLKKARVGKGTHAKLFGFKADDDVLEWLDDMSVYYGVTKATIIRDVLPSYVEACEEGLIDAFTGRPVAQEP